MSNKQKAKQEDGGGDHHHDRGGIGGRSSRGGRDGGSRGDRRGGRGGGRGGADGSGRGGRGGGNRTHVRRRSSDHHEHAGDDVGTSEQGQNSNGNDRSGGKSKFQRGKAESAPHHRGRGADANRSHRGGGRIHFNSYLNIDLLLAGVKAGRLFEGTIRINGAKAFVKCPDFKRDVFIDGRKERNRAFEGDTVVVRLLESDEKAATNDRQGKPAAQSPPSDAAALAQLLAQLDQQADGGLGHIQSDDEHFDDDTQYVAELSQHGDVVAPSAAADDVATVAEGETQHHGVVVGILRSARPTEVVGYLRPYNFAANGDRHSSHVGVVAADDRHAYFVPLSNKLPYGLLPRSQFPPGFAAHPEKFADHMYTVTYGDWSEHQRFPLCHIKLFLGLAGNIQAEVHGLLTTHSIEYNHDGLFEEDVLEEVAGYERACSTGGGGATAATGDGDEGWQVDEEEVRQYRLDLRTTHRIFSIDPTTARDLDDALSIERCPSGDGTYKIGVHIADVSHFVAPGTKLDEEARNRATSVYLVHKVLPMLPRVLCEKLCSLNPDVDRYAFSCFFWMDKEGQLVETKLPWFGKTVIRSACKLNYDWAQAFVDLPVEQVAEFPITDLPETNRPASGHRMVDIINDCKLLHKLAMKCRQARFAVKSLSMHKVKLCFDTDVDFNPLSFYTYPLKESNQLIEEYMLLANMLVAKQIAKHVPEHALLRCHPPPLPDGMVKFARLASGLGYEFDVTNGNTLHHSLERLEGRTNAEGVHLHEVFEVMATRPMKPAVYFCTGDTSVSWFHYALGFDTYTHFTSPIRRYADVIVHRLLSYTLELEDYHAANATRLPGKNPQPDGDGGGGADQLGARRTNGGQRTGLVRHVAPLSTPTGSAQAAEEESWAPVLPVALEGSDSVSEIAVHCNFRKLNSSRAQDDCDKVFLCVLLKKKPMTQRAILTDVGSKTFQLFVPLLGYECKMHVDDLLKHNVALEAVGDDTENTISVTWHDKSQQVLRLLSVVMVELTCKSSVPIDVVTTVIGPPGKEMVLPETPVGVVPSTNSGTSHNSPHQQRDDTPASASQSGRQRGAGRTDRNHNNKSQQRSGDHGRGGGAGEQQYGQPHHEKPSHQPRPEQPQEPTLIVVKKKKRGKSKDDGSHEKSNLII